MTEKCPGKECCLDKLGFFRGCYDPKECESCVDGIITKNDPDLLKIKCEDCQKGGSPLSYCEGEEKCCYGICYNPSCARCEEFSRTVKQKCPPSPGDPNDKCCANNNTTTGECYGGDKCQECVNGKIQSKTIMGGSCHGNTKSCCTDTGICIDSKLCEECPSPLTPSKKSKCSSNEYCCNGTCCDKCKKCETNEDTGTGTCGGTIEYDPKACEKCENGILVDKCDKNKSSCCDGECRDFVCQKCVNGIIIDNCESGKSCCNGRCIDFGENLCLECIDNKTVPSSSAKTCSDKGKECCTGGGCYDPTNDCEKCGPSGVTINSNCCDKKPFDPDTQECCPGSVDPLTGNRLSDTIVAKNQCTKCNNQTYNTLFYGCCKKGFSETLYNLVSEACCDGKVYKKESEGCCNDKIYSLSEEECCGGKKISKNLPCQECKDGKLVDKYTQEKLSAECQECITGSILSGGGLKSKCKGKKSSCCKGVCYDPSDKCFNSETCQDKCPGKKCCNGDCRTEQQVVCKACGSNGWEEKQIPEGYECCADNGRIIKESGCIDCDGVNICKNNTDGKTSCCPTQNGYECFNPSCDYCSPNSGVKTRESCEDCCDLGNGNKICCENVCCGNPPTCCTKGQICCGGECCDPNKCKGDQCCLHLCGNQCYDPETETCCNNVPYLKESCNQCCNKQCIDSSSKCCTDGPNRSEYPCSINSSCCRGSCCATTCCNGDCCSEEQTCCGANNEYGGCITPPCQICKSNQPADKCDNNYICCPNGDCASKANCDTCDGEYVPTNDCCYCAGSAGEYCDPDCVPPPPEPSPSPTPTMTPSPPPPNSCVGTDFRIRWGCAACPPIGVWTTFPCAPPCYPVGVTYPDNPVCCQIYTFQGVCQ